MSTPTMQRLDGLSEIVDPYDALVVDLWGVIHDGQRMYPGAADTLKALKAAGKTILFLSNAPRRAEKAENVLYNLGVAKEDFDYILTSGEATFDFLKNTDQFQKAYTYIGPEKDRDLLAGLDYEEVEHAKDAGFALVTGYEGVHSVSEEKREILDDALKHGLTLICANPDMEVVKLDGKRWLCAGQQAAYFEKQGGHVLYFGKPHAPIYEKALEMLGLDQSANILAIGDNLDTDIPGGNGMGMDTVLVTAGVLSIELGLSYGEHADASAIQPFITRDEQTPSYVIPSFAF